ncbi:S8 family serine peptidase [Spirillospora sp. NPDC048911]|uniref:S8 family peptidase n=1 Tax=Spirillospora sp. NPDC048911 TaxID=3364527 RepID=UPI00371A76F5
MRATASLTALTLAAAVAVPVALAPDGSTGRSAGQSDQARPARVAARGAVTGVMRSAPDQIRQREWHLDTMRIPRAWKWSKGLGVTVAVLDTGVDKRHPDLVGRVTNGPDLTGGTRRPGGKFWGLHGTSMASIIAGHGNGPGFQRGVIGVAPQSRILSIRVTWENDDPLRGNGGTSGRNRDAVAQGIRYAVDHGADVINMSLGGGRLFYDGDKTEEEAVRYALGKGVVLIASAGNDGAGSNRRNYPAAYDGVIAVGALDNRGRVWKDSNRRSYVAVCAPGVEIVSADASNGYVVGTGTSPSSAIAAGVAALVRARYPKLTPDEIRQALVQGSVPRRQKDASNCPGVLDATRTILAANKINKTAHGPGAAPKRAAKPSPVADAPVDEGTGTLVIAVVAGGAILVLVGLVLGWRQRRRPDEDVDEVDYLRHSESERPREPIGAMTGGGAPGDSDPAPVHVPLWQSGEVFPGGMPSGPNTPEATSRMGDAHTSPPPGVWASQDQSNHPSWPPRTASGEGNGQGQEGAYGSANGHQQGSPYGAGNGQGMESPYSAGHGQHQESAYGAGHGQAQNDSYGAGNDSYGAGSGHDQKPAHGRNDNSTYGHEFGPVGRPRRLEREYGAFGGGQNVEPGDEQQHDRDHGLERGDDLDRGYGEKRGRRHKPEPGDDDRMRELGGYGSEPIPEPNGGPRRAEEKPPFSLGDLRPYRPGEFTGSDNGHGSNGSGSLNGFGTAASNGNGHGLNGHSAVNGETESYNGTASAESESESEPAEQNPLDDESWERFRRSALEEPSTADDEPNFDFVPHQEDEGAEGPTDAIPVLPHLDDFPDESPTATFPVVPPAGLDDDDQHGNHFPEPGSSDDDQPERRVRRQHPEDDDDYRPPWW